MKRLFCILLALLTLCACTPAAPEATTGPAPTETGNAPVSGWQTIDGERYCFSPEGTPLTGWITDAGARYYLDPTGKALTGWQDLEGKRYYFAPDGAMTTGWLETEGETYYFGIDGAMFSGLLNIQGKGFYFDEEGRRYSGWLDRDGKTYYFGAEGVMAVGPAQIEGQTHYFSPQGVKVLLVNPWNFLPEDYSVELVNITERDRMEAECSEYLLRMLEDCKAAGHEPLIISAYRTQEEQEFLFNRKVKYFTSMNWSVEAAEKAAAKEIAVPGTSEHQLGLAIDLVDADYPYLDDHQANTPAQMWFMEHCHEYGFILRYPTGTTEITGIIFEPWHYRYVGVEIAQEIKNLGITLEEYLGAA